MNSVVFGACEKQYHGELLQLVFFVKIIVWDHIGSSHYFGFV
jgi:hypothetical protein